MRTDIKKRNFPSNGESTHPYSRITIIIMVKKTSTSGREEG